MNKEDKEKIAELKRKKKEAQEELDELKGDTPASKVAYTACFLLTLLIAFGILVGLVRLNVGGVAENVFAPLVADVPYLRGMLPKELQQKTTAELKAEQLALEQAAAEEQAAEESRMAAERASEEAAQAQEESRLAKEAQLAAQYEKEAQLRAAREERAAEESRLAEESQAAAEAKAVEESLALARAEEEAKAAAQLQDYVDTYSNMTPAEAAKIFDGMMPAQGNLTAMIMRELPAEQRSAILSNMNTDNAVWITEHINPSPVSGRSAEEIAAERASQRAALREQERQAQEAALQDYVDTYSNMKPQDAAKVFDSMMPDESDLIVKILQKMTARKRADILAQMSLENAAALTVAMEQ